MSKLSMPVVAVGDLQESRDLRLNFVREKPPTRSREEEFIGELDHLQKAYRREGKRREGPEAELHLPPKKEAREKEDYRENGELLSLERKELM